jgi:hypothetical protein
MTFIAASVTCYAECYAEGRRTSSPKGTVTPHPLISPPTSPNNGA